jgi:ellis van creveld syndrome protein 2
MLTFVLFLAIRKLMGSQMSMSEAERERIMKEHEKQMVLLENSLTLNKLRQQRSLEERLKEKRANQLRVLQQEQQMEMAVSEGDFRENFKLNFDK